MKIPTSSPVMVTGSTGYVGGVLVQQLLEAGLTVHCPVRDPTNDSKIQHLSYLKGGKNLKFFAADLLEQGSYLESMKGCSVVFHVASPFFMECPKGKEQELLLDPAVKGTLNVLESATEESCVKRVVLTSSVMAVATDGTDCEIVRQATGKMIDEETWNTSASIDYQPYAYSKTLAEKAAWKYVEENDDSFDLVVCNPSFVMGPGVKVHESSESYLFLQAFGGGKLSAGSPDFSLTFVDVRDVAKGHIAAGFLPSEIVANQRYILNGTNAKLLKVGELLRENYPNQPFPSSQIPKWLVWIVAPLVGMTRKMVSRSVGTTNEMDNSKSLRDLEFESYRPVQETMSDMLQQCLEAGFISTVGEEVPPAKKISTISSRTSMSTVSSSDQLYVKEL